MSIRPNTTNDFDFEIFSSPLNESIWNQNQSTSLVHISMKKNDTNNTFQRVSSDIVLVIDTSGSMGSVASTISVETNFNLLQIVIHAVKTVIGLFNLASFPRFIYITRLSTCN